eukprot:GHRR01003681.1.p2 GENE.GHRR01003681.1~~GHRR01003681.1.p2  ORF type:complete len:111 (+),score=25.27 GHRR01003681.1:918-1250(+)
MKLQLTNTAVTSGSTATAVNQLNNIAGSGLLLCITAAFVWQTRQCMAVQTSQTAAHLVWVDAQNKALVQGIVYVLVCMHACRRLYGELGHGVLTLLLSDSTNKMFVLCHA